MTDKPRDIMAGNNDGSWPGLDLLRELVETDSQSPEPGEGRVAAMVDDYCRRHGFESTVVETAPGRSCVLASCDAGPGTSLGLCGHLDTKHLGNAAQRWNTPPHRLVVDGDRAYGLGTSDMKGGIAAMLLAAQRWSAEAHRGRLDLIFTADEETGGHKGARRLADRHLVTSTALIVGEPSRRCRAWDTIFTVSRGAAKFEIAFQGHTGHSGFSSTLPTSATVAAAKALVGLANDLEPKLARAPAIRHPVTVSAGIMMSGGTGYGVHPGTAQLACEIRFPPGLCRDTVEASVVRTLSDIVPDDVAFRVEFLAGLAGWKDAVEIDPGHRLVTVSRDVIAGISGTTPAFAAYPGGTDANWFAASGIPSIAALGPGDLRVAHGPDEYVYLAELGQAEQIYLSIANRYLRSSGRAHAGRAEPNPPDLHEDTQP